MSRVLGLLFLIAFLTGVAQGQDADTAPTNPTSPGDVDTEAEVEEDPVVARLNQEDWVVMRASVTNYPTYLIYPGPPPPERAQYDPKRDRLCVWQGIGDQIWIGAAVDYANISVQEVYAGKVDFRECITMLLFPEALRDAHLPLDIVILGYLKEGGNLGVLDWNRFGTPFGVYEDQLHDWRERFDVDALIEQGLFTVLEPQTAD